MVPTMSLHRNIVMMNYQQHRLPAQQFDKAAQGLFLSEKSPSRLLILQDIFPNPDEDEFHDKHHQRGKSNFDLVDNLDLNQKILRHDSGLTATETGPAVHACAGADFVLIKHTKDLVEHASDSTNFKFFVIQQQHSYSSLDITRDLFEALCTNLGAFPRFKDMLICLGLRTCELEVAPPRPRYRRLRGRSSDHLELSYGLRWIEENDRATQWSLRQSVIYHSFDAARRKSAWIIVAPSVNARKDVDEFKQSERRKDPAHQIALHVSLIQSSVLCWRPYLARLTEQAGEHIRNIKFANPKDAVRLGLDYVDLAQTSARLKLKILEDQVNDASLALRANQDVIETMQRLFCASTSSNLNMGAESSEIDKDVLLDDFLFELLRDIDMLLEQLGTLKEKLSSCTKIASSFSDLANGDSLQRLTEAAQEEIRQTTLLTRRAQRDAAAVKALTVIASIFLPTTVVLNFFSASFIDTDQGEIVLVGEWWLFLVVSVPLTIITVCTWQLWVRRQQSMQKRRDEENLVDAGLCGRPKIASNLKDQ